MDVTRSKRAYTEKLGHFQGDVIGTRAYRVRGYMRHG
jgi:hypothetical protein